MKKTVVLLALACALIVVAETYTVRDPSAGAAAATNYYGFAQATFDAAPSVTNAVWMIMKVITDSDGKIVSVEHSRGDQYRYGSVLTNYLGEVYK